MITFFGYNFTIQPPEGATSRDAVQGVLSVMLAWIREVYRAGKGRCPAVPFQGGCVVPRPGHEIWSAWTDAGSHALAELDWVMPGLREDPSLFLRICCRLACDDQQMEALLSLQVESRPFLLRTTRYALNQTHPFSAFSSQVVRILQSWPCLIEQDPIPMQHRLLRADQVNSFGEERLLSYDRVLPVVVVNLNSGLNANEDTLFALQNQLIGLAEVVGIGDPAAIAAWSAFIRGVPLQSSALEILWPRLPGEGLVGSGASYTWPNLQRVLGSRTLEAFLLETLLQISANRLQEGPISRLARHVVGRHRHRQAERAAEAARELDLAQSELRKAREEAEALRQEAETARQLAQAPKPEPELEILEALQKAWDENAQLRQEADAGRARVADLEAQVRNHLRNWATVGQQPESAPLPESADERAFGSVTEALEAASEEFADVLAVWDDALRSAEASQYATPSKVFQALEAIAEVGRAFFLAEEGGPPLGPMNHAFQRRVPFKYSSFDSETTLSQYGSERVFRHQGRSLQMERHLTLGGGNTNNCLQIYFEFDRESRRVLIGHCGRHLPYSGQRT